MISREAIPEALAKAERYRLLNDPSHAESICLDVLRIDPENQQAVVTLILALADHSESLAAIERARAYVPLLASEYQRHYYTGILRERTATAHLKQRSFGAAYSAYEALREAMEWYERAEALRPPGNDDAILRWNTCARSLMANPELRPRPEERPEPILDD
ncbi:MAG: hypothetical protein ACRD96_12580 [Bryobacteraceae bacterium]